MRKAMIDRVFETMEEEFGCDRESLRSGDKSSAIANCRMLAMYLMRNLLGLSYPRIGKIFDKNHSTVVHACQRMEKRLKTSAHRQQLEQLIEKIGANIKVDLLAPSYVVYKLAFSDGEEYVGISSFLEKRLVQHTATGGVIKRKKMKCLVTVIESGLTRNEALAREKEEILNLPNPINKRP